jgi:hypothetical protein
MLKRFESVSKSSRLSAAVLVLGWILAGPAASPVSAQDAETAKPPKLFSSEETLRITLTAPWGELQKKDKYQGTYPAKLQYTDPSLGPTTLDLTVARRGIKRQEACRFPPIRLRFEKEAVKGTTFRGEKSLKMVTHCEKSKGFDNYYILEMIAYQMYNLLTDYSFRVRPLEVTYVDSDGGKSDEGRFAFLIEDDSDVAKRNGLKKLDTDRVSHKRLEPEVTTQFALFQYMIGNVDWAAIRGPDPEECCHNVKLIAPEPLGDDDWIIPVPYDFDSAGIVDAKYAAPPEGLRIDDVTQRLYRGYCIHNSLLDGARNKVLAQESAIMALINNDSRLDAKSKKKAGRFMEDFFETARDSGDFQKKVVDKCRG